MLQEGKNIPSKSALAQLSSILGNDGFLRVGGRLKYAADNFHLDISDHPVMNVFTIMGGISQRVPFVPEAIG